MKNGLRASIIRKSPDGIGQNAQNLISCSATAKLKRYNLCPESIFGGNRIILPRHYDTPSAYACFSGPHRNCAKKKTMLLHIIPSGNVCCVCCVFLYVNCVPLRWILQHFSWQPKRCFYLFFFLVCEIMISCTTTRMHCLRTDTFYFMTRAFPYKVFVDLSNNMLMHCWTVELSYWHGIQKCIAWNKRNFHFHKKEKKI